MTAAVLNLSLTIFGLPFDDTIEVAKRADAARFSLIWLSDHGARPTTITSPYPYDPSGAPAAPAGFAAYRCVGHVGAPVCRLPQMEMGTGVYILPLRHPLVVAQAVRTVVEVSGGRVSFGAGSGWAKQEFEAFGQNFDRRGQRMDEMLDILALAWRGEVFEYQGAHYEIPSLQQGNSPLKPPPLIFGGTGAPALMRCARRRDGWLGPPGCPLDSAMTFRSELARLRQEAGRSSGEFRLYARVPDGTKPSVMCQFRDSGFSDLVVSLARCPDGSVRMDEVEDFLKATRVALREAGGCE
jgi:alkanesulfonate monooxygenase SsuD/methylene tetrahydromethanopterin reductase-like flavin-dependent oxidoreductase (luciferase family)